MKKIFIFLILSLFITSANIGAAQTLSVPRDSLIKGELPTIYYYAADGYRYVFPNDKTFGSWFGDFGKVNTVSIEELGQIPLRGNVTYRPGVRMVKIQTVPKVYVVDNGGKLRWVKSEELAKKLYGDDWNKKIDDVPDEFFTNYQEGLPIENETDYSPTVAVEATKTINRDRGIVETAATPQATTQVGSATIPATPAVPKPGERTKAIPAIPAQPLLKPTSTPTSTPAVPAIPATPSTSTTTSTLPATPATPAIPAIPAIPPTLIPAPPPSTTATSTPGVLKVLYPNGGEKWYTGSAYTISWQNPLFAGFAGDKNMGWSIKLYRSGYEAWDIANKILPITQSSYTWTIPSAFSTASDYILRVTLVKNCLFSDAPCPEPSTILPNQVTPYGVMDESDSTFSILVAPTDTTAPSTPTNLTAAAITTTQINLTWTASADNVGVVGYKIYRNGAFLTNATGTPTSGTVNYLNYGLTAATTYTYTVAAYDAAGNVSGQTAAVSATTPSATALLPRPAPTYMRADWLTSHSTPNYGRIGQRIVFQYPTDAASYANTFRLYQKKTGETSFSKVGEFTGLSSTGCVTDASKAVISGEWSLIGVNGSCGAWAIHRQTPGATTWSPGFFPASSYVVGEYSYFVAAVDANGEGAASAIAKQVFLNPLTIQSPTESQSPTAAKPTFQWTVVSGWPTSSVDTSIVISDNPSGANPFWSTFLSNVNGSAVYDGPVLDPTKKYQVYIYQMNRKSSETDTSYISIAQSIPQFWITASPVDTTAPSTPTNLTATPITLAQINLTWTASTDNIGVAGYKVYRNGTFLTDVTSTPTSGTVNYLNYGLTAATTYTYTVAAYDAAGNVSGQTAAVSATTPSAPPPAPLAGTNASAHFSAGWPIGKYGQAIRFNYDSASLAQVQSFRFYEKKPTDSSFNLVGTFTNPAPLATNCNGVIYGTAWNMSYTCGAGFWDVHSGGPLRDQSYFPVGEYDYYVTAVNSVGQESVPSPTFKEYVLQPTEILSPTAAKPPTSKTPTFQWAVVSGWIYNPYFYIQVYEDKVLTSWADTIYAKSVPVTIGYTIGSKLYDGPALDSAKKYVVQIDVPGQIVRSTTNGDSAYVSMVKNLETFTVPESVQSQAISLNSHQLVSEIKFTKSLGRGASGAAVRRLQEALKQFPEIYPEGLVTGYFGSLTEAAVKRLQQNYGLEPVGIVGPKTRAILNQ